MATKSRSIGQPFRRVTLLLAAAILAVLVIRNTIVRDAIVNRHQPWVATGDPRLAIASDLADISAAARRGPAPDPRLVANLVGQSARLPLAPEPFLAAASSWLDAGQPDKAREALLAARLRDPRLPVTRFLLAQVEGGAGHYPQAIAELSVLMRLQPTDRLSMLPYFSQIAQNPRTSVAVRAIMASDPAYGRQLLAQLANEGASPDLILDLGSALPTGGDNRVWQERLLTSLLQKGEIAGARQVWLRAVGLRPPGPLLYDPRFADRRAPPPFAWSYASTPDGVGEAGGEGRLHVLYYGRNAMTLASQVLVLPPGDYRLSWAADDEAAEASPIGWRLNCMPSQAALADRPVDVGTMTFSVPPGCPAQKLELAGTPQDDPRTTTLTVGDINLARAP